MQFSSDIVFLLKESRGGGPVLGCFPLYPPVELFTSMGFLPVLLWNLKAAAGDLTPADRHLQNYVCGIARELATFVISKTGDLLDGIFSYNACDTLRNMPEILADVNTEKGRRIPMLRLHVPQVNPEHSDPASYLGEEIAALIQQVEAEFGKTFSSERFVQTAEAYQEMRSLCLEIEALVGEGRILFGAFCQAVLSNYARPILEQIEVLRSLKRKTANRKAEERRRVIVSGILPPPWPVIQAMERAGLVVAANDLACMRRSYAYSPQVTGDPAVYYTDFFKNRFPCTTLLYQSDNRLDALDQLIAQSRARGIIFSGEKFCEHEYFEFPYLENRLKEKDIPTLLLEFSAEDADNIASYATRVEAFAEMLDR